MAAGILKGHAHVPLHVFIAFAACGAPKGQMADLTQQGN
jgi:hypothetical protein